MKALILWSDLDKFYQKLGYKSLSSEYLFTINRKKNKTNSNFNLTQLSEFEITDSDFKNMLELRSKNIMTLERV